MRKVALAFAAVLGIGTFSLAIGQTTRPPLTPEASPTQVALPPSTPQDEGAQPLTADNVNAWLDGFFPYAIATGDIPGAVVVVVKDGQVLTERGFGYADVEKKTKVDPKTTLFRPGSISKLFTWTALMQQVEQGKVDLNADVNKYLDYKIPPYEGKPITPLNLMTHTPGFEEAVKDLIGVSEKTQIPYDKLLKRWIPKRIYTPGSTPAYSNYGASMAGYIVQRLSGEQFDDYLDKHIFGPLGMNHSTFRQPLPANLKPLMAKGYQPGSTEPYPFEYVNAAPAGSLSATGDDMAKFMIAHLQKGQYNGQQILKPETAELMHSRANSPFKAGNGMAHGFYETNINGQHVIAHGGDTVAFHSDLHLFLDKGVGIFVSFNSPGKDGAVGPLREAIFTKFADRYFPGPEPLKEVKEGARADAEKLAGVYSTTRGSTTNFLAIADLLGQVKVKVGEDGNPVIADIKGLNRQPREWIHVGPMTWRDADGGDLLTANVADGKATRFSFGEVAPIIDWDRTPASRSSAWILPALYVALGVLVLTILLWPTRALVRRSYKSKLPHEGRQLWAYRSSRIAAIAIVVMLVCWLIGIQMLISDLGNEAAFDAVLMPLEIISLIAFVGGFGVMLWYAYTVWTKNWSWQSKTWSTLLVLAAGMILYVAYVFGLISMTTNY